MPIRHGWQIGKKADHLCPLERLVKQALAVFVHTVYLENRFRQIDRDSFNVHVDRSAHIDECIVPHVGTGAASLGGATIPLAVSASALAQ